MEITNNQTMLSAIISGIFAVLAITIAHYNNYKLLEKRIHIENIRDTKNIKLKKLERIFALSKNWSGRFIVHHVTYRRCMHGDISYNQALDITINTKTTDDATKMFTLGYIYFPELKFELEMLHKHIDICASIQDSFKVLYKSGTRTSEQHAEAITSCLKKYMEDVEKFEFRLISLARELLD